PMRPEDSGRALNPVQNEVNSRRSAEAQQKLDSVLSQIKAIDARINEYKSRNDREARSEQESFEAKIKELADNKGKLAVEKNSHLMRLSQLSQKFQAEIRALLGQKEQLETSLEQANSQTLGGQLSNFSETDQKFRQILSEVRQITQQVAASRGIGVVLDSSSSGFRQVFGSDSNVDLQNGNSYRMIFTQAIPQNVGRDAPAAKGHYLIQQDLANSWYKNRGFVLGSFKPYLFNSFVFIGGYDLTQDVLITMLTQHGINKNIQTILVQSIRSMK
ncbi:hypothetical protein HYY75_04295, partial [bacterium]|nr:hypothetical protein [bacterium]